MKTQQPPKSSTKSLRVFEKRTKEQDNEILMRFLIDGVDREDIEFLKQAYNIFDAKLNITPCIYD